MDLTTYISGDPPVGSVAHHLRAPTVKSNEYRRILVE